MGGKFVSPLTAGSVVLKPCHLGVRNKAVGVICSSACGFVFACPRYERFFVRYRCESVDVNNVLCFAFFHDEQEELCMRCRGISVVHKEVCSELRCWDREETFLQQVFKDSILLLPLALNDTRVVREDQLGGGFSTVGF